MKSIQTASTGLTSLDEILDNLRMGDNVVWQVDSMEDYRAFVNPYLKEVSAGRKEVQLHALCGS